jgi:hypothetical protein
VKEVEAPKGNKDIGHTLMILEDSKYNMPWTACMDHRVLYSHKTSTGSIFSEITDAGFVLPQKIRT